MAKKKVDTREKLFRRKKWPEKMMVSRKVLVVRKEIHHNRKFDFVVVQGNMIHCNELRKPGNDFNRDTFDLILNGLISSNLKNKYLFGKKVCNMFCY